MPGIISFISEYFVRHPLSASLPTLTSLLTAWLIAPEPCHRSQAVGVSVSTPRPSTGYDEMRGDGSKTRSENDTFKLEEWAGRPGGLAGGWAGWRRRKCVCTVLCTAQDQAPRTQGPNKGGGIYRLIYQLQISWRYSMQGVLTLLLSNAKQKNPGEPPIFHMFDFENLSSAKYLS